MADPTTNPPAPRPDSAPPRSTSLAPPRRVRSALDRPTAPLPARDVFRVPAVPARAPHPPKGDVKPDVSGSGSQDPASESSASQSQSLLVEIKEVKEEPEPELEPGESAVNEARSTPSRDRSSHPELEEVKPKQEVKEEEMDQDPRSKVNDARSEPDRERERAPSAFEMPKEEELDGILDFQQQQREEAQAQQQQQQMQSEEREASVGPSSMARADETLRRVLPDDEFDRLMADDINNRDFGGGFDDDQPEPEGEAEREASARKQSERPLFLEERPASDEEAGSSRSPSPAYPDDDDDEASDVDMDGRDELEGTPYEEEEDSEEDEEAVAAARRWKRRRDAARKRKRVNQEPAKSRKKAHLLEAEEIDANAAAFLEAIELPDSMLPAKARLTNDLATLTAVLPSRHAVLPVRARTPQQKPAQVQQRDDKDEIDLTGGAEQGAQNRGAARPSQVVGVDLSMDDDLPDYVDETPPEMLLETKETLKIKKEEEDAEVRAESQAYWERPTREGAVARWAALLEKDALPLDHPSLKSEVTNAHLFSLPLFQHDRALLSDVARTFPLPIQQRLASTIYTPLSTFSSDSAASLLSTKPSSATCLKLWHEVLHPSHPVHHKRTADGRGPRACCCPLWEPDAKIRPTVDEALEACAARGLKQQALGEVVEEVFEGSKDVLDKVAEEVGIRELDDGEKALRIIYRVNSIWFDQIVELAAIRRAYKSLRPVRAALEARAADEAAQHKAVVAVLKEQQRAADERIRRGKIEPHDLEVTRELEMKKSSWERRIKELEETLKRLGARQRPAPAAAPAQPQAVPAQPVLRWQSKKAKRRTPGPTPGPTAAPTDAASTVTLTGPPLLPQPPPAILPGRSETPGAKMRRIGEWSGDASQYKGRYHWGKWTK
ncbi:hypothetical protein JCM10207_007597 [Rhodosporidiobolus poonsookiae]